MPRKAWDGFSFFLSGPQQMIKMGIIPLAILFTICLAIELERRRMEKERERSQLEEQQDAAVEEVNRILVESVRK